MHPAAFLKTEFKRMSDIVETVPGVEKLTGDNSKEEKERVMARFKDGWANNDFYKYNSFVDVPWIKPMNHTVLILPRFNFVN